MAARTSAAVAPAAPAERTLVITRLLDAPRSLVFKVWTQPEHLARWWGCAGTKVTTFECDLRPGGEFRFHVRLTDGSDHWTRGVYREVVEPERLVFTWALEDADGRLGHETLVTVTFVERGQKTELTLHHAVFESTEARDRHRKGWAESLDRLAGYLAMG